MTQAKRIREYTSGYAQQLIDTVDMIGSAQVEHEMKAFLLRLQELSKANALPAIPQEESEVNNSAAAELLAELSASGDALQTPDTDVAVFEFDAFDDEYEPEEEEMQGNDCSGESGSVLLLVSPPPHSAGGSVFASSETTQIIGTHMQNENSGTSTINNDTQEDDYSWFTEDVYDLTPTPMFVGGGRMTKEETAQLQRLREIERETYLAALVDGDLAPKNHQATKDIMDFKTRLRNKATRR